MSSYGGAMSDSPPDQLDVVTKKWEVSTDAENSRGAFWHLVIENATALDMFADVTSRVASRDTEEPVR